jgi:cytochrome c-type biogenesis protein CcmH/NrfG
MEIMPKPKGRYQVIFVIMAGIMVLSLGLGVIGPVIIDAFDSATDGGGNATEVGESVEIAFRSTSEANPDDPQAALALANYLANTGKLSDAIPWYEKAIQLSPDDAAIRLDFARSLASGEMNGDAELQFQKAIELDPQDPQAHFYLGELYYAMEPQRTVDAIDEYETTIQLGPESFVAQRANERLAALGVATPAASPSPAA